MKRGAQKGQAMVEATVMFGVIVLLFLGTWYLGKFHDIQASTIQTARYAAWERTVHSTGSMSDARLQNQARARLYTWNKNAFTNTDGLRNGDNWTAQHAIWKDHSVKKRLIEKPDDVLVSTSMGPLAGKAAGVASQAMGKFTGVLDNLTGGEALPQGGTTTGSVSVKLANVASLPAPLNKLDLTLRETNALVVNSWDADGSRQAALRTRTFTLAGPLTQLNGLLGPVQWAISFIEPAFNDLHFGQVCTEVVPADRVTGGRNRNLPAYRGGGACVR